MYFSSKISNIEAILDNDSTDESGKIIEEMALENSTVRVLRKKNGGITSTRLAGVKAITNYLVAFINGDDDIEANMYEVLEINKLYSTAR